MGSKKEEILEVLSDHKWHCTICDLNKHSSQPAAIIRKLAGERHEFDNDSDKATKTFKYGITMWCEKCQKNTTHRRLKP